MGIGRRVVAQHGGVGGFGQDEGHSRLSCLVQLFRLNNLRMDGFVASVPRIVWYIVTNNANQRSMKMSDVESGNARLVSDPSKQGIIYLLENEAFESPVIKIGRIGRTANDLAGRIRQLNIGVPLAFTCYRASLVDEAIEVEKKLHQVFYPAKRHWRGEFFEVEPWRVMLVLGPLEIQDMTSSAPALFNEEVGAIDAAIIEKERRAKFTFNMLGLPVGTKLAFVGNPEIECEVANGETGVLYEGEEYSLSTLATKLKESPYWVQGIRHWEYNDETLLKLRDRIEQQETSR